MPSAARWATPAGMTPSPHALSTTPARGSRTTTLSPAAAACSAVASPAGPPPATTRSTSATRRHRGGQGPVLGADPHREERRVGHGEDEGGDPGVVDERQREALDDDGDVVRVAQPPVAVGPAGHERQVRHDDDAGVPARPERRDAPPAQRLGPEGEREHDPPDRRHERPVGDPHLDEAADEQAGVEDDHDRVVPGAALRPAAGEGPAGVALGDDELGEPLERDRTDEHGEQDLRRHVASRSTISRLNPGPIAIMSPWLPGAGCASSAARRMWSTDAEERLPTVRSDSVVSASASSGRPRVWASASMTLGPPGWHTHQPMS